MRLLTADGPLFRFIARLSGRVVLLVFDADGLSLNTGSLTLELLLLVLGDLDLEIPAEIDLYTGDFDRDNYAGDF